MILSNGFQRKILSYSVSPNADFLPFFPVSPLTSVSPSWTDTEKCKWSHIHATEISPSLIAALLDQCTQLRQYSLGCQVLVAGQQLRSVQETFSAGLHNHTGFLSRSNSLNIPPASLTLQTATQKATASKHCQLLSKIFLKDVHSKNYMWNLCSASSSISRYHSLQCKCSNCSPPALILKTIVQYALCLVV